MVSLRKDYKEEANILLHGRVLVNPENRQHDVVVPMRIFELWINTMDTRPKQVHEAMRFALSGRHRRDLTGDDADSGACSEAATIQL